MAAVNPDVPRFSPFHLQAMEEIRLRRSLREELVLIEESFDSLELNREDPLSNALIIWLSNFNAALDRRADFVEVRDRFRSRLLEILDRHGRPYHAAMLVLSFWLRRHGVTIEVPEPPARPAPRDATEILLERQRARERREEQQRLFRQQIANGASELQRVAARNELADFQARIDRFSNTTEAAIDRLKENDEARHEELNVLIPALSQQLDAIEESINASDVGNSRNKERLGKSEEHNNKLAGKLDDLDREREKKKKKKKKIQRIIKAVAIVGGCALATYGAYLALQGTSGAALFIPKSGGVMLKAGIAF
jgi:DNA repair exonuclease SbcCD ATPase subunit